tara:strand:- start:1019 stop:1285 length:267 start_codon:yes stop_codon:yes gene_type:complete
MSKKKRGKPTIAEIVQAIIQLQEAQNNLIEWLNNLQKRLELVDNTFGAYISMTKIEKKLTKYIEKEIEKRKDEDVAESAQKDGEHKQK